MRRTAFLSMALAAAGMASAAEPVATVACDVELNVADPDPHGLNVRAAPGGKVIAVLKPDYEWISVHVAAQRGDWLRIDRAIGIDDRFENGERQLFADSGWVHVRMLGIGELFTGDGTVLRDRPDAKARTLLKIEVETGERTEVLGCRGKYLKVRHGERVGWTDRWCNNERTTCS